MSRKGLIVDIETVHEDAEIPEYQNKGDAGMDLKAVEEIKDHPDKPSFSQWFRTGLKVAIPKGYAGLIYPRSSISEKDLQLANSVGVIDSGYRGEIQVRFNFTQIDLTDPESHAYQVGDRIAQMIIMPYPKVQFYETESLNFDYDRGGGFGSTNDK